MVIIVYSLLASKRSAFNQAMIQLCFDTHTNLQVIFIYSFYTHMTWLLYILLPLLIPYWFKIYYMQK